MMSSSLLFTEPMDWDVVPIDCIELMPDAVEQAMHQAKAVPEGDRAWQVYRHGLAVAGFQHWLEERSPELTLHPDTLSVRQPSIASLVDGACLVTVDALRVCLLAVGSLTDTVLDVPRAVLEVPDFTAHVYVLVEVLEEHHQVRILGYRTYPDVMPAISPSHQKVEHLSRMPGQRPWHVSMAWNEFEADPNGLLLLLRGLDRAAFSLPTAEVLSEQAIAAFDARLGELLPQLHPPSMPIEQLLSWGEAAVLLRQPERMDWLYRIRTGQSSRPIQAAMQSLANRAMNVGIWLQNQLDKLAQEAAWVLMPSIASVPSGLRSPAVETFEAVIAPLNQQGIDIPPHARGAYRDIEQGGVPLRIYVITWPVSAQEWILLIVLGTQPGIQAPRGMRLSIHDHHECLADRQLLESNPDAHLYAQVVGDRQEWFWVTVDVGTGQPLTLPPFTFE